MQDGRGDAGAGGRRGRRPTRPEWCGVKFKIKRPPVEAEPAVREEPPIDAVPEAAPREPRPGTAARKAAADITASVVDDLGGSAAPAPAPLTPWEESLVGDAFKAPEGSRFKDRDLLAGVDVYAHMRDHAARGRPVSTITGKTAALPRRGDRAAPEVRGSRSRWVRRGGSVCGTKMRAPRVSRATAGARGVAGGLLLFPWGVQLGITKCARVFLRASEAPQRWRL